MVDFSTIVSIAPGAFTLERDIFAQFNANAFSTYSQVDIQVCSKLDRWGHTNSSNIEFCKQAWRISTDPLRIINGSLADGNYRLNINASAVTSSGESLDGDGIGGSGGNFVKVQKERINSSDCLAISPETAESLYPTLIHSAAHSVRHHLFLITTDWGSAL